MRFLLAAAPIALLAGCGLSGTDGEAEDTTERAATNARPDSEADTMASRDPGMGEQADETMADSEDRPIMQAQVVLDRQGFGPGVVDGKMGTSTKNALLGFQEANDLETSGALDEETEAALADWSNIGATRVVTIPADWADAEYTDIPDDAPEQAKLERLGYKSLDERLAERFHTTIDTLVMLNPKGRPATRQQGAADSASSAPPQSDQPSSTGTQAAKATSTFRAGQQIRVPNIGADRIARGSIDNTDWKATLVSLGVGSEQPDVAKIVVSEGAGTLKGFDEAGELVAMFTVTTGSENDPLPLGDWEVNGVAHNPPFAYDPDLFWDVADSEEDQQLPPGPNGPVGIVWIDLTKEHYGIHGTPEPQTIGRTQSHGCVRLTNWDAARLAEMVSNSTQVVFES